MASVAFQNVTKQYGTHVVLDGASFELHPGEIVGLVGTNGAGKTTIFRLISGELTPDTGTVTRARGVQIGYLRQEPDVSAERTLHDEVLSVFEEILRLEKQMQALAEQIAHRHDDPELPQLMADYDRVNARFLAAGGHTFETRMQEILGGLGFSPADYEKPVGVLSGGQRCRAALAKLLLEDKELLLLDEPTNHLDIDAVRWLEKFLAGHQGGAVIISHDRYLLDRLCQRILELSFGKVTSYSGNYSTFVETKEIRDLTVERQLEKDRAFIEKERSFIAKHLAGQRSAEAKGRRTRLERRLASGEFVTDGARTKQRVALRFGPTDERTGVLFRCDDLTMRCGDRTLFDALRFQVQAGDRLGITGPNGTGKTTMLRIALGEVPPTAGSTSFEQRVRIGYYAQDRIDLDPEAAVLDVLRAARPGLGEFEARSYLARFLFKGDEVFKCCGQLSGGEQSRVRLATLILEAPDVLILDEPTNHLDIPSREALEEALDEYAGTIMAVSHDRYFLDRMTTRLLVMRPESCVVVAGNYSTYVAELELRRSQEDAAAKETETARRKEKKKQRTESTGRRQASRYDRMGLDEIEALVIERETALASLMEKFGDPTICKDPDALEELKEDVEEAERLLAEVDAAWQERAAES